MANTPDLDELLGLVPVDELAKRFDVDEDTMSTAVQQALPGLLGGMAVNASEEEGAARLSAAAQQHAPARERARLKSIDTDDGGKIVTHVLGDKRDDVAQALGGGGGRIAELIPKLLPILAPIIMQYLSGRLSGETRSQQTQQSSGGIGDILGGLLGGLGGDSSSGSAGGGLGDVLGGILGGSKSGSGGLGGILGGLFGK